jgi:hypothetical protein
VALLSVLEERARAPIFDVVGVCTNGKNFHGVLL